MIVIPHLPAVSSTTIGPRRSAFVPALRWAAMLVVLLASAFGSRIDATEPTAVISTSNNPVVNGGFSITVTWSEPVIGFDVGDLVLDNCTAAAFSVSGNAYTSAITPGPDQGLVTIDIPAAVCTDGDTNDNAAATQFTRMYDNVRPAASISTSAPDPTNGAFTVDITFAEAVTQHTTPKLLEFVSPSVAATASAYSGSGTTWTCTVTPTAQGTVKFRVGNDAFYDSAFNSSTASTTLTRVFDSVKPAITLTAPAARTNDPAIPVTATFNQDVTGFDGSDVTVTNGTVGSFAGSGATYTFTVTASAVGTVTASVPANMCADLAGNTNTVSNTLSVVHETTQPTVAITSTTVAARTNAVIPLTITFSESVTGFALADLTLAGGTVASIAGSGATYTCTFAPNTQGTVTVDIAGAVCADLAGNTNTAATTFSRIYDTVAPTGVITSTATSPNSGSIPIVVTFSEVVTGIVSTSLTVTGGTAGTVSGSGSTYTWNVTPTVQGTVTVALAAAKCKDLALNNNTAATSFTIVNDTVVPTAVLTSSAGTHTNVAAIPVTATFSETVTGFDSGDVTVTNGTVGSFAGSGATYTFTVTATAPGAVTAKILAAVCDDLAGNDNPLSATLSVTYDIAQPTVAITSTAPASTNVAIPVTITFNETVTGFAVGDLSLSGGTVASIAGSGRTYTCTFTPTTQGTVTVDIAGAVCADLAGNTSTAATTFSRIHDSIAPTAAITSSATSPNKGAFPVTVTFSESVTGLLSTGLTITGGTASSFAGSGATYTWTVTPSVQGTISVALAAAKCKDIAGTSNTAATTFTIVNDTVAPVAALTTSAGARTNVAAIPVTATFGESVTGFEIGDITATNGTVGSFAGSGATYTFTVTASAPGAVIVNVAAAACTDTATNSNTASTALTVTYDTAQPTVAMTSAAPASTNVAIP
ncbi:MAG TPA: Ig-like domain-containing protein, partial [Planctomycetota bacterium]|nr:Ig-like domain-containing protein [Planctomycetota bacterium]